MKTYFYYKRDTYELRKISGSDCHDECQFYPCIGKCNESMFFPSELGELAESIMIFTYNELSYNVEDVCQLGNLSNADMIRILCRNNEYAFFRANVPLSLQDMRYIEKRCRTESLDQVFSIKDISNRLCIPDGCLSYKEDLSCMEDPSAFCQLRSLCGLTAEDLAKRRWYDETAYNISKYSSSELIEKLLNKGLLNDLKDYEDDEV